MTEVELLELICEDKWMMKILKTIEQLHLPNWYIGAGFIRSKVWDVLHGFENRYLCSDIDVLYFDTENISTDTESRMEEQLQQLLPENLIPWEVRNQARMHTINKHQGYTSTEDAIFHFPETVTAIAITLTKEGKPKLYLPYGIKDLVEMEVKPTPYFAATSERRAYYKQRVTRKNWQQFWPKITIHV